MCVCWGGGGGSCVHKCVCAPVSRLLSRVRLFATPWTVAYQAPLSIEFSRQGYWSGLPFPSPGDLPNPGIKPRSPALQADALLSDLLGKHDMLIKKSMTYREVISSIIMLTLSIVSSPHANFLQGSPGVLI